MEHSHTYCPAVCFLISDLFDKELNWTHQLSSDRARYIGQNKIIEGPRYQLLIQEGTDKLRLICLFYHSLNYTQEHDLWHRVTNAFSYNQWITNSYSTTHISRFEDLYDITVSRSLEINSMKWFQWAWVDSNTQNLWVLMKCCSNTLLCPTA